jgi:hypothetical protein
MQYGAGLVLCDTPSRGSRVTSPKVSKPIRLKNVEVRIGNGIKQKNNLLYSKQAQYKKIAWTHKSSFV